MNWTYHQSTGQLFHGSNLVGAGYSGHPPSGKNNPDMQDVPNVGPIPRGGYTIGAPHNTETHGPFVMSLTPNAENEMHGRTGFLIHGDSIAHPGFASEGCIIMSAEIRHNIWDSGDRRLIVVR